MQQNRFSGLKESKKEPFGVQMGPLKRGHFTPPFRGSEKGSKVEVFAGLRIRNDVDEMVLVDAE